MAPLVLHVHHSDLLVRSAESRLVPLIGVVRVLAAVLELAWPAVDINLHHHITSHHITCDTTEDKKVHDYKHCEREVAMAYDILARPTYP